MHRSCCVALAAILAAAPLAASAQDSGVSWNVSAVSDYLFRSVSQTDEDPTLQGELQWMSPVGVYVGSWASGIDYGPGSPDVEVDYYLGYQGNIDSTMHIDVRLSRYTNPGNSDAAWTELSTTTTLYDSWHMSLNYSHEAFASDSGGWYVALGKSFSLPMDLSLSAAAGRSMFQNNTKAGIRDFIDWNIGLSRSFGPVDVALGYYGTDRNGRRNFAELANSRVFLSVTLSGP